MNTPVDKVAHDAAAAKGLYTRRCNDQRSSLFERISHRKVTFRKLILYATALALLISAQPIVTTFAAGSVVVALGLILRIWSFGHLEKNQEMVTTGPFAHTRNPAYLGSALIALGLVLAAGNPDTLRGVTLWACGAAGLGLFFVIYLPRKYHKEYSRLAQLFPGAFERHARYVPNFIPRLTPWRSGSDRRFSWTLVRLNHELVWLPLCLMALAVMWCV